MWVDTARRNLGWAEARGHVLSDFCSCSEAVGGRGSPSGGRGSHRTWSSWAANHIQGSVVVHRVADNAGAVIHRGATRPELVVLWEESVPLEELGAENDPCR